MTGVVHQNARVLLKTRYSSEPVRLGQTNLFQAVAGEQYSVVLMSETGEVSLRQHVIVKRKVNDLILWYSDATELVLQDYYTICEQQGCELLLPTAEGNAFVLAAETRVKSTQDDGVQLIYTDNHPDTPLAVVDHTLTAAAGSQGGMPSAGLMLPVALGAGVLLAAKENSLNVLPVNNNQVTIQVVAGPVIIGHDLEVELFQADGITLIGRQPLGENGRVTFDVGSYTGPVIAKLRNLGDGADYISEASGLPENLNAELMALGVASDGEVSLNLNALTTLAARQAGISYHSNPEAPLSNEQVSSSNAQLARVFGLPDLMAAIVTTVDVNGMPNSAFTPDSLSSPEQYGAILAALAGIDLLNQGQEQQTIETILAGITLSDGQLVLSETTQALLMEGAFYAALKAGGEGEGVTNAVSAALSASTPQVQIFQLGDDNVIRAGEQNRLIRGSTVEGATVSLDLGGVLREVVQQGLEWQYTLTSADLSLLGEGGKTLYAIATLAEDQTVRSSRSIFIDTTRPTLSMSSDKLALKIGETATLSFTFSEDPGASFSWDGSNGDLEVSGGQLSAMNGTGLVRTATFTPTADTNNGVASIRVAATGYHDPAGNTAGADTVLTLRFDTQAPNPPSAPALDANSVSHSDVRLTNKATPTFSGTVDEPAVVTLYRGDTVVGAAFAVEGQWQITSSTLTEGQHLLLAKATDMAGNVSRISSPVVVTIDTTAPAQPILTLPYAQVSLEGWVFGADYEPQLAAIGQQGEFVVVWSGQDTSADFSIFVQRFAADGSHLGELIKLGPDNVASGIDMAPRVTPIGDLGEFVVVWSGQDAMADGYRIFVQKFGADGGLQGAQVKLEPTGVENGHSDSAQVLALGDSGEFVVAWSGSETTGYGERSIFIQRFAADATTLGEQIKLEPTGVTDRYDELPQMVALAGGSFVVVWSAQEEGGDYSIFVQKFASDGNTLGAQTKLESEGVGAWADKKPQISALGNAGEFVLTWVGEGMSGNDSIFVQKFGIDGNPVGAQIKLESAGEISAKENLPRICAVGDAGEFVVAWSGQIDGGNYYNFVQKFSANGTVLGAQVKLEPRRSYYGDDGQAQITSLGDSGEFVVTWSAHDTRGDYSIFVQKFSAQGTALAEPVKLEVLGHQNGADEQPQITALGDRGEFAVTWSGGNQLGYNHIFVQKFNADGSLNGVVRSAEPGTLYLVHASVAVNHFADIAATAEDLKRSIQVATANQDLGLDTSGLRSGSYQLYAVDQAGNFSVASQQYRIAPTIISVNAPSDGHYREGQQLMFVVNTSDAIEVNGSPRLLFQMGGVSRYADYVDGSGTTALSFSYTVASGDITNSGLVISSLEAIIGSLQDSSGVGLVTELHNVATASGVVVDTQAPVASLFLPHRQLQLDAIAEFASDREPQMAAIGNQGEFVVVWVGQDNGNDESIFVQKFAADGTKLGTASQLEATGETSQHDNKPQVIALGSGGEFAVAWSIPYGLVIQKFAADGTAHANQLKLDIASSYVNSVKMLALGNAGESVVTWAAPDGESYSRIFVQKLAADGTAQAELIKLEPEGILNREDRWPHLTALGTAGEFVLTWSGRDAEQDYSVFVQKFGADGSALGAASKLEPLDVADGSDEAPYVAAVGNQGAFVVAWAGRDVESDDSIFVQKFAADGNKLGDLIKLEAAAVSYGADYAPQIASITDTGEFAAAWSGLDTNGRFRIFVQKFASDGSLQGQTVKLGADHLVTWDDYAPQMAVLDATGNFVVAWYAREATGGDSICVQRFAANGAMVGEQVTLYSAGQINGEATQPRISALGDSGEFVVAWETLTSLGSSILVQKFTSAGLVSETVPLSSGFAQSNEAGHAYLVHQSVVVNHLNDIRDAEDALWNEMPLATANQPVALDKNGLTAGTYRLYTSDLAGNLSAPIGQYEIAAAAVEPANPNIVVFDLIEGVSSNHSNRSFASDTSYTIYVRVNSESATLVSDGSDVASWGRWQGASNLGEDDRIILVGSGTSVLGGVTGAALDRFYVSGGVQLGWAVGGSSWANAGLRFSGVGGWVERHVANDFMQLYLFSNNTASQFLANQNATLNQVYLTTMPQGVLTTQGLV